MDPELQIAILTEINIALEAREKSRVDAERDYADKIIKRIRQLMRPQTRQVEQQSEFAKAGE